MGLTIPQVYGLSRAVGLSHRQAVIATAISGAETGGSFDPGAVGDVDLEDGKWGPSVGLWQVRSLRSEYGTGGTRDEARLKDPGFNARSMYQISGGGLSWSPWSTYNDGSYRDYVPDVQDAVGQHDPGVYDSTGGQDSGSQGSGDATAAGWQMGLPPLGLPGMPSAAQLWTVLAVVGGGTLVLVGAHAAARGAS